MSATIVRHAPKFAEAYGVPVVNGPEVADTCADKVNNSLALEQAGVPTPNTEVAFTTDSAMKSIKKFGYPCVVKPVVGSWGRLMAKIDSPAAAEAILEHKATLGHYQHKVFYVQEFVKKPGRDIRVLAVDGEPIAAMTRSSDHWLTNAAKGADQRVRTRRPRTELASRLPTRSKAAAGITCGGRGVAKRHPRRERRERGATRLECKRRRRERRAASA